MRILFASPHRDLNECYQTLLTEEGRETVTAFEHTEGEEEHDPFDIDLSAATYSEEDEGTETASEQE